MEVQESVDREDQSLLRTLIYIWTGLFAIGAALYAVVVALSWPA